MDAFGGGELAKTYRADSLMLSSNLPQIRLETILPHALDRAPGMVRFGHELLSLIQDEDGVDRNRPGSLDVLALRGSRSVRDRR